MKWIVTADWHLGISEKHNHDIVNGCAEIREYCDLKNVALNLINAGDIFNNPKPHPSTYEIFNECMQILNPVEHVTIAGNHDKNTSTDAFAAYEPDLLSEVYQRYDIDNGDSCFIPVGYQSVEDFGMYVQEVYDRYDKGDFILITHTDIPGASMGAEREIQLGSVGSLPVMKNVDFIISGHIHKHQSGTYGGVPYLYPGSLARVSHTEEDQPKGFAVFDDETLEWEFVERTTDRKWATIDINWKGQLPKSALNNKADVVRLRVSADAKYRGQMNLAEIKKQLPYDTAKVQIQYESPEKLDDTVIEAGSISEYEKEWIDTNVKKHKAVVKKKLREVLTEVGSDDILKTVEGLTLIELTSKNFQSLKSVDVKFSADDCIGILGMVSGEATKSNGVGKSSFVELIRWILYGVTRYSKAGDAIQDNQSSMSGLIKFEDKKKQVIEITRELTDSNKSTAMVYCGDELLAKGAAETNKWIVTNLGLTQKAFDTIVYIGNTSVKDFISATASERLALMQEPIDLDKYKKAEKVFKADFKTVSTRLIELKGAISVHEDFLKDTDITQLKSDEKALEVDLKSYKTRQVVVNTELNKLKDAKLLLEAKSLLDDQIIEYNADIKSTENELKRIAESKKQIEPKKKELQVLEDVIINWNTSVEDYESILSELRHNLQMYQLLKDNPECPVCESKISDEQRNEQSKKIKTTAAEGISTKELLERCIKKRETSLTEQKVINDELIRLERLDKDEARESQDLQELKNDLKVAQSNLIKINKQLKDVPSTKASITKKSDKLDAEVEANQGYIDNIQNDMTELRAEILQYNEYTAKLKVSQAEYKTKQVDVEVLSICVQAVNSKGIPKFVVIQLIDQLNDTIAQIKTDFNFWQMIDIYLEPDLQKDSVSIYCSIENREYREYEGLSAGERMIVNLVLRQAYKQVLETLRDIDYSFVILDEALDKLDQTNLNAVISYFKRKRMQSLCISHNDLKDTFTRTIFVKSENGVSVI